MELRWENSKKGTSGNIEVIRKDGNQIDGYFYGHNGNSPLFSFTFYGEGSSVPGIRGTLVYSKKPLNSLKFIGLED